MTKSQGYSAGNVDMVVSTVCKCETWRTIQGYRLIMFISTITPRYNAPRYNARPTLVAPDFLSQGIGNIIELLRDVCTMGFILASYSAEAHSVCAPGGSGNKCKTLRNEAGD